MKFEDVWKEQQELNKLGQKINELQAHRLYNYGYNEAIKIYEHEINQLKEKIKIQKKAVNSIHNLAQGKVLTREDLGI